MKRFEYKKVIGFTLQQIGNRSKNRKRKNIVHFKKKYMNKSTKAMLTYLLTGKSINIKTCFLTFGFSNPGREVSRKIEKKFNIRLNRVKKIFKSKYGEPGYYFDFSLAKSDFKTIKNILNAEKKQTK